MGPAGGWEKVPDSLRLAVLAASVSGRTGTVRRTRRSGRTTISPQVILGAEPSAIAELANRRLAAAGGAAPGQRERLAETLLSWLRHWGQRAPVAAELGIHPQTVGYRAAQLRELFGDALEDPRGAVRAGARPARRPPVTISTVAGGPAHARSAALC